MNDHHNLTNNLPTPFLALALVLVGFSLTGSMLAGRLAGWLAGRFEFVGRQIDRQINRQAGSVSLAGR